MRHKMAHRGIEVDKEEIKMSVLDDVKDSLFTAGKEVSQKAKDVSEIAKLRLDLKSKQDFVENQYKELGRAYYQAHKDAEEMSPQEAEQFANITEALEEINRMHAEILAIKGALECPKCGNKMPEGATFCSKCGTKLDDMFEEE